MYEGLVVIGQPVDEATKQTVQKEIVKQETNVDIVFEKPKQQPRKIVDKEGTCLFTPSHPICKPDPQGKCPRGWGTNEGGQCFPMYKKCPAGYWRADDDETGACVPLPTEPVALAALPPCDGSFQDCIYNGHLCEAGSTEHECELPDKKPVQGVTCQEEDDFCEPGCESPSMDCIDDVNIGDDGEDSTNEEETANCGGESCTPTEKEDSWTDEEEEESEGTYEDDGYLDEEEEEEESNDESSDDEEAGSR